MSVSNESDTVTTDDIAAMNGMAIARSAALTRRPVAGRQADDAGSRRVRP